MVLFGNREIIPYSHEVFDEGFGGNIIGIGEVVLCGVDRYQWLECCIC